VAITFVWEMRESSMSVWFTDRNQPIDKLCVLSCCLSPLTISNDVCVYLGAMQL
jgi:hypothetical protein